MGTLVFNIISSDEDIMNRWQKALQKEGWPVHRDTDGTRAFATGKSAELDLIEIGEPACRTQEELKAILKARNPVSAIVFGEQKNTTNGQIAAFLEAGADDFVYKNLDERVLVAKLKAHIRRIMPAILEASAKCASTCGEIQIDTNRHAVYIKPRHGKAMELSNLTQRELAILVLLVDNEKRVVSRESMLEKIWGDGAGDVYSECVDKHIESLRRKLGLYGKRIRTVYGSGYMFTGG